MSSRSIEFFYALDGHFFLDELGELFVVEFGVETTMFEEFLVGAALDDFAFIDDEDHVGGQDGREAVGNRQGSTVLHQGFQGGLY